MMFFSIVGGFSAFIIRVSGLFLAKYQSFVLTKSMIKKLYTKRKHSQNDQEEAMKDITDQNLTDQQKRVMKSIVEREGIS